MASKLAVLVSTIRDANERNEFFGALWGAVLLRAVGGVLAPHHANVAMYWHDVGQRCQHFRISNDAYPIPMCPHVSIVAYFQDFFAFNKQSCHPLRNQNLHRLTSSRAESGLGSLGLPEVEQVDKQVAADEAVEGQAIPVEPGPLHLHAYFPWANYKLRAATCEACTRSAPGRRVVLDAEAHV